MRIFPAAARTAMPWRNGGGVTTEVAAFPEGAGLADFDWRVSIARIDGDGPFSLFPGIDRTLALLSGGPVTLTGRDWQKTLSPGSDPIAFDGGDSVEALVAAPSTDLNVMSRRGRCTHRLEMVALPCTLIGEALVIAAGGGIVCNGSALHPLDAVLVEEGETAFLNGPPGARIWSVAINKTPQA